MIFTSITAIILVVSLVCIFVLKKSDIKNSEDFFNYHKRTSHFFLILTILMFSILSLSQKDMNDFIVCLLGWIIIIVIYSFWRLDTVKTFVKNESYETFFESLKTRKVSRFSKVVKIIFRDSVLASVLIAFFVDSSLSDYIEKEFEKSSFKANSLKLIVSLIVAYAYALAGELIKMYDPEKFFVDQKKKLK